MYLYSFQKQNQVHLTVQGSEKVYIANQIEVKPCDSWVGVAQLDQLVTQLVRALSSRYVAQLTE